MQNATHANQKRIACERCRKQKLRCSRPSVTGSSCTRCEELGLECQLGTQRRVGRPTKKDIARKSTAMARVSPQPAMPPSSVTDLVHLQQNSSGGGNPGIPAQPIYIDPILFPAINHNTPSLDSLDWTLPEDPSFLLGPTEDTIPLESPIGNTCCGRPEVCDAINQPEPESPPLTESTIIHVTTNVHFTTLSRLNMELHGLWETMSMQPGNGSLEGFVCGCNFAGTNHLRPYQSLMKISQDYLLTIKALHKSLGTRADGISPRPCDWRDHGHRLPLPQPSEEVEEEAPSLTSKSSTSGSSSSSCTANSPPEGAESDSGPDHVVPDSPTALLVISCFCQIVEHLEIFFKISQARLLDPTTPLISPANATFAGVRVTEFPLQGALFGEMLRCNFAQIIVVLGLPTKPWWSGKTIWTGLLADDKYRELLNNELGSVENGWTTRPTQIIRTIENCEKLLNDVMMSGCTA